jgi:hypothetical protein
VKLTAEQASAQRAQAMFPISHAKASMEFLSSSATAPQMPTRSASPDDDPPVQSRVFLSSTDGYQIPSRLNCSDTSAQSTQVQTPVNSDDDEEIQKNEDSRTVSGKGHASKTINLDRFRTW